MGSTASKPTETKVFTPSANIEIGSALINQLEQSIEVSLSSFITWREQDTNTFVQTDYTRTQYTAKTFEAEVSKKLEQLSEEAQKKFESTVKGATLTKDSEKDQHISSADLTEKLAKFQGELEKKQSKFFKVTEELQRAKSDVVKCLITNKETPLNCWDEVKSFEKLVSQI